MIREAVVGTPVPKDAAAAHTEGNDARSGVAPERVAEAVPPSLAAEIERFAAASERLLDLAGTLDDLVRDGLLQRRQAEDILIAPRGKREAGQHPLEIVLHLQPRQALVRPGVAGET